MTNKTKGAATSAVNKNAGANRDVLDILDDLHAKQIQWADGIYKNATAELIEMLGEALYAYKQLYHDSDKRKALTEKLKAAGMKVNNGTSLSVRIVRWVFRTDGRCFTYGRVLRNAHAADVEPNGLATWIEKAGGIEQASEITAKKVVKQNDAAILRDKAVKKLKAASPLATLDKVPTDFTKGEGNDHGLYVALLHRNSAGKLVVVHGTDNGTLCERYLNTVSKAVAGPNATQTAGKAGNDDGQAKNDAA